MTGQPDAPPKTSNELALERTTLADDRTDLAVERVRGLVSEAQKRTQKRVAEAQKNVRKVEPGVPLDSWSTIALMAAICGPDFLE